MKIFERLRAINSAFFAVLRAEIAALNSDLSAAAKRFLTGVLLVAVTLGIAGVLLAVLVFVLIAVLAQWLPWWGAGLVVAAVLALAAALSWFAAMRRLRGETPGAIVQRHVNDHLDWWQNRVSQEASSGAVADGRAAAVAIDEDLEEDLP